MSRLEEGLGNATAARCDRCDSAHEHQEWQHGHGGESKERHWWHRQAFHDVFIMLALKCHDCLTFRTQTASGQSQCKYQKVRFGGDKLVILTCLGPPWARRGQ